MIDSTPEELVFTIDGLAYHALAWGGVDAPVVLGCHGWLDNALSFARLGPALTSFRFVSVDMSGHGLSDHRSPDATYNIWDDLPQLQQIVDQVSPAQPVYLVGHSRGASIAMLLAMVLGERCAGLVMIDGALRDYTDDRSVSDQLIRFVNELGRYRGRGERFFDSIDDYAERRGSYGFSHESGRLLAARALEEGAKGWRLRNDVRLYGASAVTLSGAMRPDLYGALVAPLLLIKAEEGMLKHHPRAASALAQARESVRNFREQTLPGGHHLHMEADTWQAVADTVDEFLSSLS